jgi:hypothetical protein
MLHQFGWDCLVMIAFVRVDEQPLGLNGILDDDFIFNRTIKSRTDNVFDLEDIADCLGTIQKCRMA